MGEWTETSEQSRIPGRERYGIESQHEFHIIKGTANSESLSAFKENILPNTENQSEQIFNDFLFWQLRKSESETTHFWVKTFVIASTKAQCIFTTPVAFSAQNSFKRVKEFGNHVKRQCHKTIISYYNHL